MYKCYKLIIFEVISFWINCGAYMHADSKIRTFIKLTGVGLCAALISLNSTYRVNASQHDVTIPEPNTNEVVLDSIEDIQTDTLAVDTLQWIKPKLGLYFNYGMNLYSADFVKLPGTYSCCSKFKSGTGTGLSFGALYDYPINNDLWLNLRIGFNQLDGEMSAADTSTIISNGISQKIDFEHRLNSKIGLLNLDAMLSYRLIDNLFVSAGAKLGVLISKTYTQIDKITNPATAIFDDTGLPYRNYSDGEITEAAPFQAFLTAGLSYELPLNKKEFLFIVPEFSYSLALTNLVNGISWKSSLLKGGISIKYQEPPPPPPPPPAPIAPPFPELPQPIAPPLLSMTIDAQQIDSLNNVNKDIALKIEDFISYNMRPMLNYIFFDNNSARIPERYFLKTKEQAAEFDENSLQNMDVLPTYYYVLNILGKRLQDAPKAKITLTGTNSGEGDELNNLTLSNDRAIAVRNYLVDVWDIASDRITVKAQNLPSEPSNSLEPGGNEENRRVEITSNEPDITEPVITTDTIRKISTSTVQFLTNYKADVGIKSWELNIEQNGIVLKSFSGSSAIPEKLDWIIDEKDSSCPTRGGDVTYRLTITDKLGQAIISEPKSIKIDQLSIDKKRIEGIADKEFEFYSLILFDYGKSKLGVEHKKTANLVKKRVTNESKVSISGFTDSMGREEINKRISSERANEFAKRLKIKNAIIIGKGESELLYDNNLPEGRFYCRTVKITIETPISNQHE